MKKVYFLPLFILATMILFSCDKKEETVEPEVSSSLIQPENLEVGQVNYYLRYTGEKYYDENSNHLFEYTNDTLKVEIIDLNDDGSFTVEESYTPGSEILNSEHSEYYHLKFRYFLSVENDSISFTKSEEDLFSTHLIYLFSLKDWGHNSDKVSFPLKLFTENETEIDGWKTTSQYVEAYNEFFAKNVTLLNFNFGTANVIVNNVPMQVDGNGMTYVYNRKYGFVRTFTYSWWTGGGTGWDLIVD